MFVITNTRTNRLQIGDRFATASDAALWITDRGWLNADELEVIKDNFTPAPEDAVERTET